MMVSYLSADSKGGRLIKVISPEHDGDNDEIESDEEYMYTIAQPNPNIDTMRVEEIPAKEPKMNAVPLKSALKKRPGHVASNSSPATPTQDNSSSTSQRPLVVRQHESNSYSLK